MHGYAEFRDKKDRLSLCGKSDQNSKNDQIINEINNYKMSTIK